MLPYRYCGALLCGFIFLWGCAGPFGQQSRAVPAANHVDLSETARLPAQQQPAAGHKDGSLWVARGGLSEMFINNKARGVGDIITIAIVENSTASNQASTNTGRASELSVGLTNFFGLQSEFPSDSRFLNPFSPATGSYENTFDGTGSTVRSGALSAYITARIVQVLPNGNFFIEGNREVRINNENQIITLTGLVRSQDISADNVIKSTYIADARINYSGSGVINDEQRPGWLMRFLDNIWPF